MIFTHQVMMFKLVTTSIKQIHRVCILHTIFALEMCTISEWFKLWQYSFHGSKVLAVCAIIFL